MERLEEQNEELEEYESESELTAGKQLIKTKIALEKAAEKFKSRRKLYSRLLIVLVVALTAGIIAIYLMLDASNVRSIKVINNTFLSAEYIKEVTGISTESEYMLTIPMLAEMKGEKSPLIDQLEITKGPKHSIVIDVKENPIVGYRYDEKMELIMGDGSFVEFDSKYIDKLALLPMFISVPEEKTIKIAKEMAALQLNTLMRISEVRDFALSYDEDMVKFVMDDTYRVYCPINGISFVDNYLSIIKNSTSKNKCIHIESVNQVAIMRSCEELETMYEVHKNEGVLPIDNGGGEDNKQD